MCGCGCIENDLPICKFPGPKGSIYVLNYSVGCYECETPIGVYITKYKNKKELEDVGLGEIKDADFTNDLNEIALQILEHDLLLKVISEFCKGAQVPILEDEPMDLKEFLDIERDCAWEVINKCSYDSVKKSYIVKS